MVDEYKCRECGYTFKADDVAISIGPRRMTKNPCYPTYVTPSGTRVKSSYPIIIDGPGFSRYYCKDCYEKGIPLDTVLKK